MKWVIQLIIVHVSLGVFAQESKGVEIIYGRKDGLALSMIMLKPLANDNGKAIINVVSGGWESAYAGAMYEEQRMASYLEHGFTIFNVIHGSQPKYNVRDALDDIKRSVRYIRYHATTFNIDPDQIGITGGSSGGHLALMVATTGGSGITTSKDPVETIDDNVQAVAVFFPPTDFLNYGGAGYALVTDEMVLKEFRVVAVFDFKKWDDRLQEYRDPTNEEKINLYRDLSPVYHVSPGDAPALIVHGDSDNVVPMQQSEIMISAYRNANVQCDMIVKTGAGHGWDDETAEHARFVSWFDQYLK